MFYCRREKSVYYCLQEMSVIIVGGKRQGKRVLLSSLVIIVGGKRVFIIMSGKRVLLLWGEKSVYYCRREKSVHYCGREKSVLLWAAKICMRKIRESMELQPVSHCLIYVVNQGFFLGTL